MKKAFLAFSLLVLPGLLHSITTDISYLYNPTTEQKLVFVQDLDKEGHSDTQLTKEEYCTYIDFLDALSKRRTPTTIIKGASSECRSIMTLPNGIQIKPSEHSSLGIIEHRYTEYTVLHRILDRIISYINRSDISTNIPPSPIECERGTEAKEVKQDFLKKLYSEQVKDAEAIEFLTVTGYLKYLEYKCKKELEKIEVLPDKYNHAKDAIKYVVRSFLDEINKYFDSIMTQDSNITKNTCLYTVLNYRMTQYWDYYLWQKILQYEKIFGALEQFCTIINANTDCIFFHSSLHNLLLHAWLSCAGFMEAYVDENNTIQTTVYANDAMVFSTLLQSPVNEDGVEDIDDILFFEEAVDEIPDIITFLNGKL